MKISFEQIALLVMQNKELFTSALSSVVCNGGITLLIIWLIAFAVFNNLGLI